VGNILSRLSAGVQRAVVWTFCVSLIGVVAPVVSVAQEYVQSTNVVNFSTNASTLTKAFTQSNTAGNTIIVSVSGGASISSIADARGNAYSLAVQSAAGTDAIYYARNIRGGSNTITATFSASTQGLMYIHEYAGLDPSAPLDQVSVLSGSGTAVTSGSKTTTQANELIFGYAAVERAVTAGESGFAIRETAGGNMSQDRTVSATGSYAATFTEGPSGVWTALMATFRGAGTTTSGGTLPPTGNITSPTGNATINVGGSVNFAGSGTDPQALSLTYDWNFGGAGIPDSTLQNPGSVQFNTAGTFTVTFTVTDSANLSDPNPPTRTITVQSSAYTTLIPQSVFSLLYADSQELSNNNSGAGVNAFDGNITTVWHTQWVTASPPLPHEIQVNLNGIYNLNGFHYLPNQDSNHGWIGQYEFYVSKDGINWGNPVTVGTFPASAAEQDVVFPTTVGHYVRFRDIANVYSWQPWTSVSELNLTRYCATTPSVMLSSPWSGYLQSSNTLIAQAQVCLNSAEANWGVQFVLDGTQTVNTFVAPFQATFKNLTKTEHTVDAYIIDNLGNRVAGTGTHDHAYPVGDGDYYVTMGDSITYGYGDTYAADDMSNDGRNTGGGYEPILNNLLTSAKGYPQTVINEGVQGTVSLDGLNAIPWMLGKHTQATMYLIMYGMNDARPWLPVPSGQGLNPGDPGYAGTYKDHMQQIITAINNAGKRVALARVNVALADCADNVPTDPGYCAPYSNLNSGARNVLIQQYNQVTDELRAVTSNNITIVPPDFYTYFSGTYSTQYFDNIHPNGIGYQSMGNSWFQALK